MNVLCVLPYIPWPAESGGTLRTLELVRTLARTFDVTVLAAVGKGEDAEGFRRLLGLGTRLHLVDLRRWGVAGAWDGARSLAAGTPPTYVRSASAPMRRAFEALASQRTFQFVHFEHLHAAQLLPLARRLLPRAQVVIDQHNVESCLAERVATMAPLPARPLFHWNHQRVLRLETQLVRAADALLACSETDARLMREMGARRVHVVPNGMAPPPQPTADAPRRDVIFVGAMDWLPNTDAAVRLARGIWPQVRGELGESRLLLVGRKPPQTVRALASSDVEVTGTVPSVTPYLQQAWASAIPLRVGSGTRLKILEAAAHGVPVVSSRLAMEGLPLEDGRHLLLAETDAEFASALRRLHQDAGLRRSLAEQAHDAVARYAWESIGTGLLELYRALHAQSEGAPSQPPVSQPA